MSASTVDRFKQLPRHPGERWQGGLVRLPSWIDRGPDGRPYRPWAGIWVSLTTGLVNLKVEPETGAHGWALALDALLEFGLDRSLAGYRPARLEVKDRDLGARLLSAVGDTELALTVSSDLPAVNQILAGMAEHVSGGHRVPGALDVAGVTVDRMRAFADAAKRFYEAAPWRHLTDEDLISVEAPAIARGLRHVAVLGAARHTFGLGFFDSVADHDEMIASQRPEAAMVRARWSLFYGPISEIPFGDADLWEEHGLPVAGDDAYPVAVRFSPDGKLRRPDAGVLAYLEGLLRALADTSEGEMDRGRWVRQAVTYDGPAAYRFALPDLLEPPEAAQVRRRAVVPDRRAMERATVEMARFMSRSESRDIESANAALRRHFSGPLAAIPSTASTHLEKAQDIVYQAFAARGRRRIKLAREALALSPDCADAYVILAEEAWDRGQARDLYAQGVAAGERALGPQVFAEEGGRFWGLVTTRPYMRARFGLAQTLEALGQTDEAIDHYRELLRLNPNDNQGIRYSLLPALLTQRRDEEAGALLDQFRDDPTALWRFGQALWMFRREGDSPSARESLSRAVRSNRHVRKYLSGKEALRDTDPPSYAIGSEEEAVIFARALGGPWRATQGASEWLRTATRAKGPEKRARSPRPGGRW